MVFKHYLFGGKRTENAIWDFLSEILTSLLFTALNYNQLNIKRSILVLVEEEKRGW